MKYMIRIIAVTSLIALATNLAFADGSTVREGNLKGAFSSWGKSSLKGDWKIVQDGDQLFIELAENFVAKEGPDVKILLSPTSAADITGKNAGAGSLFVHQISDFKGGRRIAIPDGIDLNDFKSLVFHCEEYSKLWGSSSL